MERTHTPNPNPIRSRRHQLGLSLRGLAAICGTSATTVYLAEIGRRTLPVKLIRGLCDALQEPYEGLLEAWLAWRTNGAPTNAERLEGLIRMTASNASGNGGGSA